MSSIARKQFTSALGAPFTRRWSADNGEGTGRGGAERGIRMDGRGRGYSTSACSYALVPASPSHPPAPRSRSNSPASPSHSPASRSHSPTPRSSPPPSRSPSPAPRSHLSALRSHSPAPRQSPALRLHSPAPRHLLAPWHLVAPRSHSLVPALSDPRPRSHCASLRAQMREGVMDDLESADGWGAPEREER